MSKFSTEEVTPSQNFNFAPKFTNWGFLAPDFVFLETTFFVDKKLFQQANK